MTAILTDFEKLAEVAAQFTNLTAHVSGSANVAIERIDELIANTSALISETKKRADEDVKIIESDAAVMVTSLEEQRTALIEIRGAFAEPEVKGE